MTDRQPSKTASRTVTIWLDPVCPFSWNTARWLSTAAETAALDIDWRLMSLAILNAQRQLPPPQQARMHDSRHVGRLMVALRAELGADAVAKAYFAFGHRYFDESAAIDDDLVTHVLAAAGAHTVTAAALSDASLDGIINDLHQASQDALGEATGSPIITIDGHTMFGPVLTSVPASDEASALFEAVATLVCTSEFTQLERPRTHA
ncbi:hypothetical protein A5658_22130 [Mycobacterium sp. 1245111.1]|uniref:mycothiol-dependent nitroreductase Rv2466c family protein n=1 Tax=Mycobacterium sp. 1245111.1 TaxID=1834073 RepID=UPI0007FD4B7B|nr:DsbA family protein [Mycobacterium sp. 1245111.1]OBK40277.1 hypothetical protein A5658_22130 [Mycobacterium sp. 1245111.1]